ncbi:adenylate/guanylate cyclase domain-containing protein [Ruegeria sp. 2205SS24-7]|uniref:adenylate/guanylate cyclase domain-containing protein n=1 Tax=Ruegeria discodermiae TaxID=3064389 RepID=UPI002740BD6D|nr:adenylate/guanylate cyclase domain-containing protein [Ruegeria sp. 2205SS24-7]MDP5219230.1 adenylate/guanylate cyclase domain-containing protein [Ruegeria sp. 2205SS24-7]
MANVLWQGSWLVRARIISGLILFAYALFHFLNIGMGLISVEAMDAFQAGRHAITRNPIGSTLLYGAFLIHIGIALYDLATRRTVRMSWPHALQVILGLLIPLQLLSHLAFTRFAHEVFDVNDKMSYLIVLMWNNPSVWYQSLLLLLVWVHGCMGLHFWLRLTHWWQHAVPYLIGLAVLVPAFAFAGLLTEGRNMWAAFGDPELRDIAIEYFNWPDEAAFQQLFAAKNLAQNIFWALLAVTAIVYLTRKLLRRRRSVKVSYVDGPEITSERGMTLLEMSRANNIPHTALCGGKGRCTTCRVVIEEGADLLHPPSEAEARSLQAVGATANTRLACQIRPVDPLTVHRVFRPQGGRTRAHASQGQERQLAILFLDMRGFTSRTAGQLPYDVVFFLNRFFDAIVPAVTEAGGNVDKYMGDGFLAVFESATAEDSARAGLRAAEGAGKALEAFNQSLADHNDRTVQIGMALHLGNVVLGEIGTTENAPRTIIGDAVNATSRLQAETKRMGVELIVSAPLLNAAGYSGDDIALHPFKLRGVSEPIRGLPVVTASQLTIALAPLKKGAYLG